MVNAVFSFLYNEKLFLLLIISALWACHTILYSSPAHDHFFLEGLKQLEQQQYADAVTNFTRYLQKDSTKAVAYYNRAIAYKNMGALPNAINDLERVLELDPADSTAKKHLLVILYENAMQTWHRQDTVAALQQLEKYLHYNPTDDIAWYNKGVILSATHNKQEAVTCFSRALALQPQPTYYLARAIEYFTDNRYDKALADLEHSITGTASDTLALWMRAQIYFNQKQYKLAANDLNHLLSWRPDLEEASLLLNEIKIRLFFRQNIYLIVLLILITMAALYFAIKAWAK